MAYTEHFNGRYNQHPEYMQVFMVSAGKVNK